jgi:hypothetical protein
MPPPPSAEAALRSIDAGYRHQPKRVSPRPPLTVGEAALKWYNLAPDAEPVPEDIERRARAFLGAQSAAREVGLEPELGFVILHRCGQAFYFLLVSTWRGTNELWETIFYKENEAMQDFGLFTFKGAHRGTFCVWELGAVLHEKDAWVRFLESARTSQNRQAYLESRFEGAV